MKTVAITLAFALSTLMLPAQVKKESKDFKGRKPHSEKAHAEKPNPQRVQNLSADERAEKRLAKLTEELKLSEKQQNDLRPILIDTENKREAVHAETTEARHEKVKAIRAEADQKIKAILTVDQQAAWEQKKATRREHKFERGTAK